MTRQKTFKRRVRDRMTKTGESYTAARRMLIAHGRSPGDPEVRAAGGRGAGRRGDRARLAGVVSSCSTRGSAASRTHTEIARWLRDEHAVDGWYSQSIAVGYERARGLRAARRARRTDSRSAPSRTVAVPVERLFEMFDGRAAARALAAGRGAARAHGHVPADRPLRLGGRLDPGRRRASRASARRRAGWRSPTSGCRMPRPPGR